jgi:D-alanine transfer protein
MYRHLLAAVLAGGLCATGVGSAEWYVRSIEARSIQAVAPRMFDLKNQGVELQAAAFRQPDLLVVYGSSELEGANPFHASTVFENYPTGFTIFPIGRGETTCLVILQDLAAVGPELHGKRVVISVSPPWFFLHDRTPNFYAPNYSPLHLSALVFDTDLSYTTRQLAVQQLMQSPTLFSDDPLVAFAAERLSEDTLLGHAAYLAVLPLGKLHNAVMSLQDLVSTYTYLRRQPVETPPSKETSGVNWSELTRRAETESQDAANNNDLGFDNTIWTTKYAKLVAERTGQFNDAWFVDNLHHTAEFTDLDILLRGLSELGADTLLLSQPIPGKYYDRIGISADARSEYYARLRQVAGKYDVPVVDFEDHDSDIYFVTDPNSHLSREGWAYYDRALDAFYHGTLAELVHTDWSAAGVLPGDTAGPAPAVR